MKTISVAALGAVALAACSGGSASFEDHELFGPVEFCYFYEGTGTKIDTWTTDAFGTWDDALDAFAADPLADGALADLNTALAPLGDEIDQFRQHAANVGETVGDDVIAQELTDLVEEVFGAFDWAIDQAATASSGEEFFITFGSKDFNDFTGVTDFELLTEHFDANCGAGE